MRILKADLEAVFKENKMVAVAQNNSSNSEDLLVLKHRLKKHNISVKFFPNQVNPSLSFRIFSVRTPF